MTYFGLENMYGDQKFNNSGELRNADGNLTPGRHYRSRLSEELSDYICAIKPVPPKTKFGWGDMPANVNRRYLKTFFDSAMNVSMSHVLEEDAKLVTSIYLERFEHNTPTGDLYFGEILLAFANKLTKKYGGSVTWWLLLMFNLMDLDKKTRNFGDNLRLSARKQLWTNNGYGIFGNRHHKITHKPISFSEEYDRFINQMDRCVLD